MIANMNPRISIGTILFGNATLHFLPIVRTYMAKISFVKATYNLNIKKILKIIKFMECYLYNLLSTDSG